MPCSGPESRSAPGPAMISRNRCGAGISGTGPGGGEDVVVQLGVEPGQLGQLDQRVDRPGGLPVDEGDRRPSRATMFHGATSQWPMTLAGSPKSRPCQGNHTAAGGGRNDRVASCRERSRPPDAAAPSRLHGPGWVNSPSMNVSTSRPSGSRACSGLADERFSVLRSPGRRTRLAPGSFGKRRLPLAVASVVRGA